MVTITAKEGKLYTTTRFRSIGEEKITLTTMNEFAFINREE